MSWLNRFRSKSKRNDVPDFSGSPLRIGEHLITDVHSHMVPGVDDGSESLVQSMEMIERLVDMGYRQAVITPHIHSDIYPNSIHTLKDPFKKLKESVAERWPSFKVHLAAEYFMDDHFEHSIGTNELLWFPGLDENGQEVKCVLFEFGFHEPPMNHEHVLFELQMAGYTGVLAHAERYPYWHKMPQEIESLAERGVWITVNAASLAGAYGPEMYRVAKRLIENNIARMICSDAHGMRHMESLEAISKSPAVQHWLHNGKPASANLPVLN